MKVLVFTPEHIFNAEKERTLEDLRIGFQLPALAHTSFISARRNLDVHCWDDLEDVLTLDGQNWNSILVPLRLASSEGRAGLQFDRDLDAFQKLIRRMDRKNIVGYIAPETNGHTAKLKNTLVSSGLLFVHDARDGYYMLHNWLVAAAAMTVPLPAANMIEVGPLKIDFMGREITVNNAPVRLNRFEYRLLMHLAGHQGTEQATSVLQLVMRNDVQEISGVHQVIGTLRKKISTPDCDGANLIRTVKSGGYVLVTNKDLRDDALKDERILDFGRFRVNLLPDGSGRLVDHDVTLDIRDLAILNFMKNHAGEYLLPATIAEGAFPGMGISGLSVGKKLANIKQRFMAADMALGGSIAMRYKNKLNHVMLVPEGTTAHVAENVQLYRDLTRVSLGGWIDLELSAQFNRKKAHKAARVAGTNVILDPRDTAALLYAFKRHGEWLVGRMIKQDELGPNVQVQHFFKHMKRAFDKLQAAGLQPERFMTFDGKSYVRVVQKDAVYSAENKERLAVPLIIKDDVEKKLNAGDWFTLAIRKNGTSVIVESNRALNVSTTAIFKYAIENPDTILSPRMASKIFPKGVSAQTFNASVHHLKDALTRDGYEEALYHVPFKGALFIPKPTYVSIKDSLPAYFSSMASRQRLETADTAAPLARFIGPLPRRVLPGLN